MKFWNRFQGWEEEIKSRKESLFFQKKNQFTDVILISETFIKLTNYEMRIMNIFLFGSTNLCNDKKTSNWIGHIEKFAKINNAKKHEVRNSYFIDIPIS